MIRAWIVLLLAGLLGGCTTLRVATPQQASDLDDLDWQVERPAAPPPVRAPGEVTP